MCCSIRAAVFFLSSLHIFFAITQMVSTLPLAVSNLSEKLPASILAFIFCLTFFATGFMTFRGADEESGPLIRLGSLALAGVLIYRFIVMFFGLMLVETLPEAGFLYVYGTPVIPIIFTTLLYLVYLALLFCYHNELSALEEEETNRGTNNSAGGGGMSSGCNTSAAAGGGRSTNSMRDIP